MVWLYDIQLTNTDAAATKRALAALELVIVQDMFLNQTARECRSRTQFVSTINSGISLHTFPEEAHRTHYKPRKSC